MSSNVLQLEGLVACEDAGNVDEARDILKDVFQECSKFGRVAQVVLPTEADPATAPRAVYVEFHDPQSCLLACTALSLRAFDGKAVAAACYDQQKFNEREF